MIKWIKYLWREFKRECYKAEVYSTRFEASRRGKFRVLYKDGKLSERMDWTTATTYASIFDGKVIDDFKIPKK